MQAYHNDAELKRRFIDLIEWHRAEDKLLQDHGYWEDGKGCAVGCSIQSLNTITGSQYRAGDHGAYEPLIGVPRILAKLEDGIFEGLPDERAQVWPGEFAEAIRPGADLSGVWAKFAHWLLSDVIQFARTDKQRTAIQRIINLYAQTSEGVVIERQEWRAAADAAAYAADAAAYAAAYADAAADAADAADAAAAAAYAYAYADAADADAAYAAYAADADAAYAAYAYAYAAAYAAAAAAYAAAAAAAAAREQARVLQADKLLELLRAA